MKDLTHTPFVFFIETITFHSFHCGLTISEPPKDPWVFSVQILENNRELNNKRPYMEKTRWSLLKSWPPEQKKEKHSQIWPLKQITCRLTSLSVDSICLSYPGFIRSFSFTVQTRSYLLFSTLKNVLENALPTRFFSLSFETFLPARSIFVTFRASKFASSRQWEWKVLWWSGEGSQLIRLSAGHSERQRTVMNGREGLRME